MKNSILVLSVLLITVSSCRKKDTGEPPEPPVIPSTYQSAWEKTYGGSHYDHFYDMAPAANGGYVLVGGANSNDGDLAGLHNIQAPATWLTGVDSSGNKLWSKVISITPADYPYYIKPSADGGYFLGTHTYTSWQDHNALVSKITAVGDTVWTRSFKGSKWDGINSIIGTADGGVLVSGFSGSADGDFVNIPGTDGQSFSWITKINSNGATVWIKKASGGRFISTVTAGGYVLISGSALYKIDENGNDLWKKDINKTSDYSYTAFIQSNDGGYIGVGNTPIQYDRYGMPQPDGDVSVIKYDGDGNVVWEKTYGGSNKDVGWAIAKADNGYIISALAYSTNGDVKGNDTSIDSWLFKINDSGKIIWSTSLGYGYAGFYSMIALPGNTFVACGETSIRSNSAKSKEGWIIKFKDQPL